MIQRLYNPLMIAAGRGIDGLIECVTDQALSRATGAITVASDCRIYLVFGHPLHATCGELTGVSAVEAIADRAGVDPGLQVGWTPTMTAGRAFSLSPRDGVVERLRARRAIGQLATTRSPIDGGPADGRPPLLQQGTVQPTEEESGSSSWADVIRAIKGLLEADLKAHAAALVEEFGRADPEPRSILLAVERARSMPVRMVDPRRITLLLDQVEVLVKARLAGT